MDRATPLRRTKKRRRHSRHDEQQEGGTHLPGLAGLQQSVGNRAVQRMLSEEQAAAAARQQLLAEQLLIEEMRAQKGAQEPEDVVDMADMELLSGEQWVKQYPASDKLTDLDSAFGQSVTKFVNALENGGATVDILSTAWPPERAYMMHFAWLIANEEIHPRQVPPIDEVEFDTDVSDTLEIIWWHGNLEDSQKAAEEMVEAFGIAELEEPPVLNSRHISGEAIDMRISWGGTLLLVTPGEEEIEISSGPKDETNAELIALAATFGVIHYEDVEADAVHWSVDGS